MLLDLFEQLSIQKKHLLFIESMKILKIKKKILAEKRICWRTREGGGLKANVKTVK